MRRLVFSILVSNTDDHLRNHGFLRHLDGWQLSPAYELNPNPEPGNRHLTTLVDLASDEEDIELALSVADFFRLWRSAALDVVSQVEGAMRGWATVAHGLGAATSDIERMVDAFDGPQREQARRLAA